MAKNQVPEPQFVHPEDPFDERLQAYLEDTFHSTKTHPRDTWVADVMDRKSRIANAFGVPDCETGVLIQSDGGPSETSLSRLNGAMVLTEQMLKAQEHWDSLNDVVKFRYAAEMNVCRITEAENITDIDRVDGLGYLVYGDTSTTIHAFDYKTLGYTVGKKQVKWVKRLRKLLPPLQKHMCEALTDTLLCGVLSYRSVPWLTPEETEVDWGLVLSKLGDALVAEGYAYFISFDPLLLLRQADNQAGNSSCHRPFGQYHMGPWVYLHDEWTFTVLAFERRHILQADTPEKLDYLLYHSKHAVGRCLYMLPDPARPALVQSRFYGRGVTDETLAPVRAWLRNSLRKTLSLGPDTWRVVGCEPVHGGQYRPSECYVDLDYFKGYYLGSRPADQWVGSWKSAVEDTRCPYCGRGLDSEKRFSCSCMAWATCEECGDCIYGDDYEDYGDGFTCPGCGRRERCARCGDYHSAEDMRDVGGDLWCEYCVDNYAVWCENCEGYSAGNAYTVLGRRGYEQTWCEYCTENHAVECDGCGALVDEDYILTAPDDSTYCSSCYDENVGTCDECGETFMVDDLEDGLCESCREREESEDTEDTEGTEGTESCAEREESEDTEDTEDTESTEDTEDAASLQRIIFRLYRQSCRPYEIS